MIYLFNMVIFHSDDQRVPLKPCHKPCKPCKPFKPCKPCKPCLVAVIRQEQQVQGGPGFFGSEQTALILDMRQVVMW